MATLERRVSYFEGQVQEQSRTVDGVRDAVGQLAQRVTDLAQRVTDLEQRMDRRFEGVDRRFEGVERRLHALDDKISRHFTWVVGIQVTTLVAIVAALLAR